MLRNVYTIVMAMPQMMMGRINCICYVRERSAQIQGRVFCFCVHRAFEILFGEKEESKIPEPEAKSLRLFLFRRKYCVAKKCISSANVHDFPVAGMEQI